MANKFKSIRGWKEFGGKMYLLLELVRPRMQVVWPGEPSLEEPAAQLRRHTDMVVPKDEVYELLTDSIAAAESGLSGEDLLLLRHSLEMYPLRNGTLRGGHAAAVSRLQASAG